SVSYERAVWSQVGNCGLFERTQLVAKGCGIARNDNLGRRGFSLYVQNAHQSELLDENPHPLAVERMLEFSKRPDDLKDGAGLDTVLAALVQKDGVALVKKVGLVLLLSPDYLKCRRGLLVADETAAVDVGSSGNGTRFVFAGKCHCGRECK